MPDHREALRAIPLFSTLTDRELRRVADLAREERFSAGEDIVTEGHTSGPLYLLTDGDAVLIKRGEELAKLGPGDFFGEMAVIDQLPRSATVRATTEVKAIAISGWDFVSLLERNWSMTHKVLTELSKRVREHDDELRC